MGQKLKQTYRKCRRALLRIREMESPTHASHACYFIVLAAFPALLLAVGTVEELNRKAGTDDFETAFVTIVKEASV